MVVRVVAFAFVVVSVSVEQTEIMVYPKNVVTPPPSPSTEQPSATPSPSTEEPTAMPTGTLAPVGLLPLARTGGDDIDKFYAKVELAAVFDTGDIGGRWAPFVIRVSVSAAWQVVIALAGVV